MQVLPKMDKDELLKMTANKKVMLFFTADWCPDCRFIKPVMPEIEEEYSQFEFITVDRDENIDLCAELDVYGIPSFVAFEDGKEIGRYVNKDRKTRQEVEVFIEQL